jgi:hypothetical protein
MINNDGFGWAMMLDREIRIFKSMSLKDTMDSFFAMRDEHPYANAMFHLRFSTHGTDTTDNCHPFVVGGDSRTVLAHNGILDVDIDKGDLRSDTRVFAEDWLPTLGVAALDDDDFVKDLERWAIGSKLIVFSLDERMKRNVYMLNAKDGYWDDGIWYSNRSHEPYQGYSSYQWSKFAPTPTSTFISRSESLWAEADPSTADVDAAWESGFEIWQCGLCDGEFMVEARKPIHDCPTCGGCFTCEQIVCDCEYPPGKFPQIGVFDLRPGDLFVYEGDDEATVMEVFDSPPGYADGVRVRYLSDKGSNYLEIANWPVRIVGHSKSLIPAPEAPKQLELVVSN